MTDGDASITAWIDAGLFDPDDPLAEAFGPVLEFYSSVGIDPQDFVGTPFDELIGVVNMSVLRPGPWLTADEVRDAAGLDEQTFNLLATSAGYTPDQQYTTADVRAFEAFSGARELFTEEALDGFVRVLAASMARVADATSALFRIDVAPRIEAGGGTEVDWARNNYESSGLIGGLFVTMEAFFLNQLVGAVRLSDQARIASTSDAVSTVSLAVGFVDIVGYTQLSMATAPDDLARFISAFEKRAIGVVTTRGGRLVKLIGDEIMFVTVEPDDAVGIAMGIIDAFADTDAVPRGGVAFGEVIGVGGDYYGPVVNLASRVVDQAVPGEVLVDEATASSCTGDATFSVAGRRQLKGFADPVPLWTVER